MTPPLSRSTRALAVVGTTLGLIAAGLSTPAYAVPPPNDAASTSTTIPAVPATLEADTREATRDATVRRCVEGHSVWYRYTPSVASRVKIVTIGSNFDTVLAVYQGRSSPRDLVACNDDAAGLQSAVRPSLEAGRTYWLAMSSCCRRRGGDLVLRLYEGGTPGVRVTVDRATSGAISGRLRVWGTVACDTPSFALVGVVASERVGEGVARGHRRTSVQECLSEPVEWTARIDSSTGWAFAPGTAAIEVAAVGLDGSRAPRAEVEQNLPVADDPSGRVAR
jgi:hypothetical protein